jgi:Arc/MetJ family transcription regulator
MRTTVTLDDELLEQARAITGTTENSALINQALRDVVAADAARRLIALGGTMPDLVVPDDTRGTEG